MPCTDSSDSQKPPIPLLAQHEEEPGVSCFPGGEAERGEVREEAALRLLVTEAAWLRCPDAPMLCAEGERGVKGGKSCSSPRWEPAKGRAGAGRGRRGPGYVPGPGQRGRSCANTAARGEPSQRAEFTGSRGHPRPAPNSHPKVLGRGGAAPSACPKHHGQDGWVVLSHQGTLGPCCAPGVAAVPAVQGPQPSPSWGALGAARGCLPRGEGCWRLLGWSPWALVAVSE